MGRVTGEENLHPSTGLYPISYARGFAQQGRQVSEIQHWCVGEC